MPKKTAVKTTKSKSKPVAAAKKAVSKNSVKETYSKTYTNMFQAYKAFWKRGFTEWAGTSSRSEYWWSYLMNWLILICGLIILKSLGRLPIISTVIQICFLIFVLASIVPMISIKVRRLHDIGFSAWWILLLLFVGIFTSLGFVFSVLGLAFGVVLFVCFVTPTKFDGNPYHKNNKYAAKKAVAKNSVKETYSKTYTNMFQAYKAFWKRGFTEWAGTSSRSEYWWSYLVNFLLILVFGPVLFLALDVENGLLFVVTLGLVILYALAAVIPWISLFVRRLHDSGKSAWWLLLYLVYLIPELYSNLLILVVSIIFLIFTLLPTKKENNPYHKNNK